MISWQTCWSQIQSEVVSGRIGAFEISKYARRACIVNSLLGI